MSHAALFKDPVTGRTMVGRQSKNDMTVLSEQTLGSTNLAGTTGQGVLKRENVVSQTVNIATLLTTLDSVAASTVIKNNTVITSVVPGGGLAWTVDTAVNLIAGYPGLRIGDMFVFYIDNQSGGANDITIGAAPAGVTYRGGGAADLTISQNEFRELKVLRTGAATVTIFISLPW